MRASALPLFETRPLRTIAEVLRARGLIAEGTAVQHPRFGRGKIDEIRANGKSAAVTFDSGRTEILHLLDLDALIGDKPNAQSRHTA